MPCKSTFMFLQRSKHHGSVSNIPRCRQNAAVQLTNSFQLSPNDCKIYGTHIWTLISLILTSLCQYNPCYYEFCYFTQDFHSHLTTGEVVGYIAGRWDPNTQGKHTCVTSYTLLRASKLTHRLAQQHHITPRMRFVSESCFPTYARIYIPVLSLEKAYPCKCRLWDLDNAANTENEVWSTHVCTITSFRNTLFSAFLFDVTPFLMSRRNKPVTNREHLRAVNCRVVLF